MKSEARLEKEGDDELYMDSEESLYEFSMGSEESEDEFSIGSEEGEDELYMDMDPRFLDLLYSQKP